MKNQNGKSGAGESGKQKTVKKTLSYVFAVLGAIALFNLALNFTLFTRSAHAASNGVINSILKGQICEPDNNPLTYTNNIGRCINNIYVVALGLSGAIAFMMFIIAGYMYVSGSEESVASAKRIMGSTFAGLLILILGYVILNTIDPSFTKIPTLQGPATADCSKNPEQCSIPKELPNPEPSGPDAALKTSQDAANALLAPGSKVSFSGAHASGVFDNANAHQNIIDAAAGKPSTRSEYKDPTSGRVGPGGFTSLDTNMLNTLVQISKNYQVSVSELAGGVHSQNSKHYQGKAFDINYVNGQHLTPNNAQSPGLSNLIIQICKNNGASLAQYEPNANHVHCEW